MIFRCRNCEQKDRALVREREHWMALTRELNDRLMVLAERPWTLPPSALPTELREPEPAYLFDPGPENET